jgi:hypothetical protein
MEKREHFNDTPGQTGKMSVEFDIASGKAWSYGAGFWSIRQARAFFEDWRQIVGRIHSAGKPVSALVDLSQGAVQRPEVADIIAATTVGLYAEGDAVAMLVSTSLAKMQMRRVLDARFHGFFTSRNAAETWLNARSLRLPPER